MKESKVTNKQTDIKALLKQLEGIKPIRIRRISILYSLGLLLVTFTMILLPLLYLGLIVSTGYGLYYYYSHVIFTLQLSNPVFVRLLIYVSPGIAGIVLIYSLLKPLFVHTRMTIHPLTISPEKEPFLYAFADQISRILNAPFTHEIKVNMEINASAGFCPGLWSFISKKMQLTIGLPLVRSMTVSQFAGILSHELGHFSQGSGMRMTYIIRSLNMWFALKAEESREIRNDLRECMENSSGYVGSCMLLAILFVTISGWILSLFKMLGIIISFFMLRQMEYSADRYEIVFTGSESFNHMMDCFAKQELAEIKTNQNVEQLWAEEKCLIDDWPEMVSLCASQISKDEFIQFKTAKNTFQSGLFQTHPSTEKRVKRARKMNQTGFFHSTQPASILFGDLKAISKEAILPYYEMKFMQIIHPEQLKPIDEFKKRLLKNTEGEEAVTRYFFDQYSQYRPIHISEEYSNPVQTSQELVQTIDQFRQSMNEQTQMYSEVLNQLQFQSIRRMQLSIALSYIKAKIRFKSTQLNLKKHTFEYVYQECLNTTDLLNSLEEQLIPFETAASNRLNTCFSLLFTKDAEEKIENVMELREEINEIIHSTVVLTQLIPAIEKLNIKNHVLTSLLEYADRLEDNSSLSTKLHETSRELHELMSSVLQGLASTYNPLSPTDSRTSLREYACSIIPDAYDFFSCMYTCGQIEERLLNLQHKLFSRLVFIAETIESAYLPKKL